MTASLKRRLIWILLALILFAWVTSALVTYVYSNRVLDQQVDRQLQQYADLVGYITGVFARQIEQDLQVYENLTGHDYGQAHLQPMVIHGPTSEGGMAPAVNIWEGENLIAVVANSPRFDRPVSPGFAYREIAGEPGHWRTLARKDEGNGLWVLVGIELGAARESMLHTLGRSLLPLLIILPLTVIVLYLGVSRGLLPLRHLAAQISDRNPGQLDPVDTESVPAEVAGVVGSLNVLLGRLASALEGEQRFTANAAHELMTPLAAIKTEVQLCQRQMKQEPGRTMLERIAQRVDRASHTVEQLLTLARVDPDAPMATEVVSLDSLLSEVLAETAHLCDARQLSVDFEPGPECQVTCNSEALAILLRNLLVNAFRYASPGSAVQVVLADGPVLTISNDCEPLSKAEFANLSERFYRVPGSAGLGAGLGLSIVRRVAELHGATLAVGPWQEERGFSVRVGFSQLS
jgi:two-component system, OmpR family, sensor kinase